MARILPVAAVIVGVMALQQAAQADEKPWCMNVEGGERCYFDTAEQCGLAASAGSRGLCHRNPWYQAQQPRQQSPRRNGRRR